MRYTLNLAIFSTVDSAIKSIPGWNVTELDLSHNSLSTKQHADILTLIHSIPAHISTLNLSNTALGQMQNLHLILLLENLPSHVTTLILTSNGLGSCNKTDEALSAVFSTISQRTNVSTLALAWNDLGTRDNPEIFNALTVNTVNLRSNHLGRLSPETLVAIVSNHYAVHLGNNELTSEQLHAIANARMDRLEHLDLRTNRLNQHPEALRALTSSLHALKTLDLADNQLGDMSTEDMTSLVQALPLNTKTLDLSSNKLWRRKARGLRPILLAIQTGVTTLILDNNELHTVPYLVSALESMPAHIQKLSLERNYWGHVPYEAFLAVINSIPAHVTAISLRNNGLSLHPITLMGDLRALKPHCDLDFSNNRLTRDVENTMIALTSTSQNTGLKALGNDLLLTVFTFLIPVNTTIRNDFFLMTDTLLTWQPIRENGRITDIPYPRTAEEINREYQVPSPIIPPHEEIAQEMLPAAPYPILPNALQDEIRFFQRSAPTALAAPTDIIQADVPHFLIQLLSHPMTPVVSVVLLLAAAAALTAGHVVVAGIAAAVGAALLAGHLGC